ncbi:MAG: uroporphyrinogen-III C-methyltransferase, partial [Clostridia bacterium]|nr:uroporphyrinogen-III C-methyltransferase [Clostridia bacterium]
MVYLVGAGMGESDLITLRGISCIKKAEAIIYDRLADVSLLSYAPDDCLLIYAGKQSGNHTMPQEEINSLLVKYGKDKTVVRLKGGDSFVFGRGGEEVKALIEYGIDYELVAGVSSSYGAAEYAGIPVTLR